jgi:hypothetical protein
MRFAWLRSKEGSEELPPMSSADRLIFVAYNVVWWVPAVLPFLGILSYRAGFLGFLVVSVFRAVANVYRNNVLTVEAAQHFPLRSP